MGTLTKRKKMAGFACITMHTRVHIVKVRHGRQHNSSGNSWGMTRTPCQPPVYPQQRSTLFSSCHGGGQTRPMPTRATSGEISSFVCSDMIQPIKDSRSLPFVSRGLATSGYRPPPCRAYMWTILPLKTGMASVGARSFFYMTDQRSSHSTRRLSSGEIARPINCCFKTSHV